MDMGAVAANGLQNWGCVRRWGRPLKPSGGRVALPRATGTGPNGTYLLCERCSRSPASIRPEERSVRSCLIAQICAKAVLHPFGRSSLMPRCARMPSSDRGGTLTSKCCVACSAQPLGPDFMFLQDCAVTCASTKRLCQHERGAAAGKLNNPKSIGPAPKGDFSRQLPSFLH